MHFRRTISGMAGKPVYPPSSATRPYHRPQSPNSTSSSSSTGLGDIFQQERYVNEPDSDYSNLKNNNMQRNRRHQELQQRTAWNERQQAIVTAAATTRAQAQQQQEQQEQVELGRLVKQKPRIPSFSIIINKKLSNSTTIAPPAAPPSPELEWTLAGPANSDQVETDTEEEGWMRVNPGPAQEEMVKQIRATDKGKMKYDQMQEWNPTLTRILRRRQHSPTGCKDEVPKELKFYHPPPPPPAPQTVSSEWKQKYSKIFPHQKNPMIDTTRLNPQEWPKPAEASSKLPPKSHETINNNKLKAIAAWQEEFKKMEENIHRYLQIPNHGWYTPQLNDMQQTHKDMPLPLNIGSNIPHTTIRVCAKCGQVGHWGIICTNLVSKPESSIDKCTFCTGHHKNNTCQLRKKLMPSSGHANVQYVNDTIVLKEDENDSMHFELVVANWLQDKHLNQQYVECMEKDNLYKDIYKRARDGEKILTIQYKDKFLYILKTATWKLVIPTGLKIRSKSAQEHLLQLAQTYRGHGGLDRTNQELTIKRRPVWTFLQPLHAHLSATNHL